MTRGLFYAAVMLLPQSALALNGDSAWTDFHKLMLQLTPTYKIVLNVSMVLILLFFVYSIVVEQVRALEGKPDYFGVIKQLFLVFIMFNFYNSFFNISHDLIKQISERIFSEQEFRNFLSSIWQGIDQAQGKDEGVWGMLRGGISTLLVTLSYIICAVTFRFLAIVRYTLLGFLYVVGPIWLAVSVLPGKRETFYRFIENVLLINAWSIVANILLKIMFLSAYHYHLDPAEDFLPVIAANLVLASLLISTPKITTLVARGEGLSGTSVLESSMRKARELGTTAVAFAYAQGKKLGHHSEDKSQSASSAATTVAAKSVRAGDPPLA